MSAKANRADSLYELGELYKDRCEYGKALQKLEEASELYCEIQDYNSYLKAINIVLRIYAEKADFDKVDFIKERIQDLVIKEKMELSAKTYYTLGLCASFKSQHKTALEYLEKSLSVALNEDDKEGICYAISGMAIVYASTGRYEEALKELYNLQIFFQVLPMPELQLASLLVNGNILRILKKYDQALDIYWQCYDLLKDSKNQYMYVHLLYSMGLAYKESGDTDMGRMYLTLAKKMADPENLKFHVKSIDESLAELGAGDESSYDLIFNQTSKMVQEKKRGKIDFKNQFILMDLLRLFLTHPGEVYSKEDLVERVWKQMYDPRVHDNKIYVTIKRLRKMIEPDYDKPKYIFRAKNGYYLNKNTRVLVNS